MLTKLTANNRVTLPKSALSSCENAEYFEVSAENGRIILTPMPSPGADAARADLAARGVAESDAADAVKWARSRA